MDTPLSLEAMQIHPHEIGTMEPVFVHDLRIRIEPDQYLPNASVHLQAYLWDKNDPRNKHVAMLEKTSNVDTSALDAEMDLSDYDVIIMPGGVAPAHDMVAFTPIVGKMTNCDHVVVMSHPEAPTSRVTPDNAPLNGEDFKNSGYVTYKAIERMIKGTEGKSGVIKNKLTVITHSGGFPDMIEAANWDRKFAKQEGREPYIQNFLAFAPAGIIPHESTEALKAAAGSTMMPVVAEILRDLKREGGDYTPPEDYSAPKWMDRLKYLWNVARKEERMSGFSKVVETVYEAVILPGLEKNAYLRTFWRSLLANWTNSRPHTPFLKLPGTEHDFDLLAQAKARSGCAQIHDLNLVLCFSEHDAAVLPEALLQGADFKTLADYRAPSPEKDDFEGLKQDLEMARARELFPKNQDTLRVLLMTQGTPDMFLRQEVFTRAHHNALKREPVGSLMVALRQLKKISPLDKTSSV